MRTSEAQYRSMVSALDECILVFGTDRNLQACNLQAERFNGTDLHGLRQPGVFRPWRTLRADSSAMTFAELPMGRVLETGEGCRDVLLGLVPPEGGLRWITVKAEPVRDAQTGELTALHHAAHSIKGASAAIGATRLPDLAGALDAALFQQRPGTEIIRASQAMRVELESLLAGIREHLAGHDSQPAPLGTESVSIEALDRLEALLAAADFDAAAALREIAAPRRRQFGAGTRDVETRVDNFDYRGALAALRTLRRNEGR